MDRQTETPHDIKDRAMHSFGASRGTNRFQLLSVLSPGESTLNLEFNWHKALSSTSKYAALYNVPQLRITDNLVKSSVSYHYGTSPWTNLGVSGHQDTPRIAATVIHIKCNIP